jgi:hypothetical protein
MLARTMWLEHGMWVSCRRGRGSISPNCNKLDFESVVQLNFVASDPTTMAAARWRSLGRQCFFGICVLAIQQSFWSATAWFEVFSLPIA